MTMKRILMVLCLLPSLVMSAFAQQEDHNKAVMEAFTDSLNNLTAEYLAYIRMWDDLSLPAPKGVRLDPDAYKLFVPLTYYTAPITQAASVKWQMGEKSTLSATDSLYMSRTDSLPKFELPDLEKSAKVDRWVNSLLLDFYLKYPTLVMGNEMYFMDMKPLDEDRLAKVQPKDKIKDFLKVEKPTETTNAESELVIVKPNFWKKAGRGKVQFTQHGISDNWYQGGESTNALYSELVLTANYDDKQKVQFENMMEVKLGFITAPSDTVHSYKTNSDLFRLYSKLGVKAFEKWYYTLSAEFKTQFFPNYNTNSNNLVSSFLTPMQLKLSVGMDYKYSKGKYSLSVFSAPLTYKYVSLKNGDIVNPSAFEVEAGKKKANLYGSELTVDVTWKIRSDITWRSKFYYFTTYKKVLMNWENTFEFKLRHNLSTTVFLHPRFDDGVTLSGDNKSYFQFKEMLTFGLSYEW